MYYTERQVITNIFQWQYKLYIISYRATAICILLYTSFFFYSFSKGDRWSTDHVNVRIRTYFKKVFSSPITLWKKEKKTPSNFMRWYIKMWIKIQWWNHGYDPSPAYSVLCAHIKSSSVWTVLTVFLSELQLWLSKLIMQCTQSWGDTESCKKCLNNRWD